MLRADFHRAVITLGEKLSQFRLLPFLAICPYALPPSPAVLERRYGGEVLLNSDDLQPLFQIRKKTRR